MGRSVEMSVVALAAGAWIATTVGAAPAHACSFVPPCQSTPTLALVGDVMARPTNACIALRYARLPWYDERASVEPAYVAPDGRRIALAPTEVPLVYCPTEALAPDTDYVLVTPTLTNECAPAEEVEALAFHTALGPDVTPPSAPGVVRDLHCDWSTCDSSACCGPYETVVHETAWEPATDASGDVVYLIGREVRFGSSYRWAESGAIQPVPVAAFDRLPPDRVRAVDIAGHVGPDAEIAARCDAGPPPRDAAVDPDAAVARDAFAASDAGAAIDASMGSDGAGGGCQAADGRARTSSFALLALGLTAARVAARRSALVRRWALARLAPRRGSPRPDD